MSLSDNARLADIIASVAEGIVSIDDQLRIVLFNPAAEQMFGRSREEMNGQPLSALVPERFRAQHDERIRNFAATGQTSRGMGNYGLIYGLRASGEEFPINASISQMASGGQRLFTVILRDITRRIEAEKALRKNYELLDRIFATTHFCVVYLDRDLNFVRVNKAYADACGHPPEFFPGKNHFDLYPGEKFEAIFRQVVATGKRFTSYANPFEFPDYPERGVTYWDWTLHPLMSEGGDVEGLLFVLVDVTERERTQEALRSNERSLRVALKSVDMALFHQDLDLRYTWMYSPQLGYTPEDVVGKGDSELLPPEDALRIIDIKRRVLETGVSARAEVSVTQLNKKHYFDLVVEPLRDAKGQLVGVTGASLDITERKRTERELQHKTKIAQLLEKLARTANEAVSPEAAMENCLRHICEDGKWALGRVATFPLGLSQRKPDHSQWFCTEPARFDAFMRYSDGYEFMGGHSAFINLVLRDQCPVWLPDLTALDTAKLGRLAMAAEAGLKAAFAFPVIVRGEVAAFLEFFATETRQPDTLLIAGTSSLASQFARLIERRRSERINAQLAAIVESSNDAIVSRGFDRAILTWNPAAERLFGYTAAEVIGRNVSLIIPADQEARGAQVQALLKDGLSVPTYDAVRLGKGGRRLDVSIAVSPIKDSSGKMIGVSIVFRDISERKRAEVERAQLAAIVESSNDAILIRGPDRTILSWNAAAERLFGWSAQEAVGQSIDLIVPPERLGILKPFIERAARGEPVSPVEIANLRKDGARIPTQITFSPVRDKQGKVIAHSFTVRDMTELKRNEEALRNYATRLRELSHRLQEMEATERNAISRELHDRIGQGLTTLSLMVGTLGARLPEGARRAVQTQMKDIQALLRSVVANVRDVMAELRPPVLDDYGLLAALRHLVTEFANRTGIAVNISGVDPYPRLPSIVETAMFRISQEALNNIAKHAQAKKVEISLNAAAEQVVLDIADDGVGFDTSETRQDRQHWGMITMRERAEAVGITFRLKSAPGAGTRIVLEAERTAS